MMSGNLAGSMGCVGQPDHPEVIKTVTALTILKLGINI